MYPRNGSTVNGSLLHQKDHFFGTTVLVSSDRPTVALLTNISVQPKRKETRGGPGRPGPNGW